MTTPRRPSRIRMFGAWAILLALLALGQSHTHAAAPLASPLPPSVATTAASGPATTSPTAASVPALPESLARKVGPLERVLRRQNPDSALTHRIATAIVRESARAHLPIAMVTGVLLIENPELEPQARSHVGAKGLMQVMPFWAGTLGCRVRDLTSVEGSICHGVRILAAFIQEHHGNVRTALLRYNGCVRGANTPECDRYPGIVLRRADRVREQLTHWQHRQPTDQPVTGPTTTERASANTAD